MNNVQILLVSLIPIYALVYFLIFSPVLTYCQRYGYAKGVLNTKNFVASPYFGLITYVCGNIGCGKTTCSSGLVNILADIKKEQAFKKIDDIRIIFNNVDFNEIDSLILVAFKELKINNSNLLLNYLLENHNDLRDKLLNKYYDAGLYPVSYISLLRDYIDAYLAILRNNYCYFWNRKFYCYSTKNWAMPYNPDMIDIKNRSLEKDYSILRYTTIFEDEKALTGKVSTEAFAVAREDGGADVFYRLIRHFGKGTIHTIITAQDFGRIVKQERELATGVFYIEKREEHLGYSLKSVFIDFAIDFLERYQIFYLGILNSIGQARLSSINKKIDSLKKYDLVIPDKLNANFEKYSRLSSLKESKIKKILSKLNNAKNKIFADGFISYKGKYFTNPDDVERAESEYSSNVFKEKFIFPLCFCYGSSDTYNFSILHDYLVNESESHLYDDIDFDSQKVPDIDDKNFDMFISSVLDKNKTKLKRKKEVNDEMFV